MPMSPHDSGKVRTPVDLRVPVVFSLRPEESVAMSVRITVLLEEDVDARFTAFCQDRGFKKSTLAARLIREHLTQEAGPTEPDRRQKSRAISEKRRGTAR